MAYSAMVDLATGAVVTEAEWDKIKGNFDFLANPPRARVKRTAVQSIPNNTVTEALWTAEDYDTNTIHDNSTNTGRLTCKTAGTYHIQAAIAFAGDADGFRLIEISLNGVTTIANFTLPAATSAIAPQLYCATDYPLAVNDYVKVVVWHTAGAALDMDVASRFTMRWVSL